MVIGQVERRPVCGRGSPRYYLNRFGMATLFSAVTAVVLALARKRPDDKTDIDAGLRPDVVLFQHWATSVALEVGDGFLIIFRLPYVPDRQEA